MAGAPAPARVVRLHGHGGPEVLRVDEVEVRPPAAGEVRIRVEAMGLNRSDEIFRSGHHPVKGNFPSLIGSEAAGTIESIGEGVTGFAAGDAVNVVPRMAPEHGTFGALINAPARFVIGHLPELSMVDAAGLWASHLTAYGGLITAAGLKAGDRVLLTAASSSVGLAAIQIVNMLGATAVVTTRDDSKAQRLLEAGAAAVVATDKPDWIERLRAAIGGDGADVILDAVSGPDVEALAGLCARKARYVFYGGMSGKPTPFPLAESFAKQLTFRTYTLDATGDDLTPAIAFITRGVREGKLRACVDRVYPMEEVGDAFRYLESNRHFGKIMLTA